MKYPIFSASICFMLLQISVLSAADTERYTVPIAAKESLIGLRATVLHGRLTDNFIADLTPDQVVELRNLGFEPEVLLSDEFEKEFRLRQGDSMDEVHSYDEMLVGLQVLQSAYPEICRFEQFGYSVENRELFGVRITDNPLIEEDEPEIVFWGAIHGDEDASAEMPYLYAHYLCENYGTAPLVTDNIQNNEIWCVPILNPDGHDLNDRFNANGIDLNREFGFNWDGWGFSPYPFSQPESRMVREFCITNNPVLSVSYHCFGNEFYYPWGYFSTPAPDFEILSWVGECYANAAAYALMSSFESYQTHGEVLDWVYGCLGGLSFTAEVSLSSSAVQQTFERNRPAMDLYGFLAGRGLHGAVKDAQTGEPLHAAIWIDGNPVPSYTDPQLGDFHRIVTPGSYNLTVWANGYLPQNINDIEVSLSTPGEFHAELEVCSEEYAFMVTSVNQDDPFNNYNNITCASFALGEPDGLPCSIGSGGFIVLDMGQDHEIVDTPGDDFTVTEVNHPRDPYPESYEVYAGNAYEQNRFIGSGRGTSSFDLAASGIVSTRFLKIIDTSGANPNLPLAGIDLDGITILSGTDLLTKNSELASNKNATEPCKMDVCPNPFNPRTTISFSLSAAEFVNLSIFDISGRLVAVLVDGYINSGVHEYIFEASEQPSGLYFYRIEAGEYSAVRKMVLMK